MSFYHEFSVIERNEVGTKEGRKEGKKEGREEGRPPYFNHLVMHYH